MKRYLDGKFGEHLDAVDLLDGHSFIVQAPIDRENEAVCMLAALVGMDLEDG